MRRRLYRIVALPLALWFVALATDVGGVDACPMHDAMAHGMAAAMATMPMGGMPGVGRGPATPAAPEQHGPVHCTCMGLCCGCAMATLPSTPTAALPAPLPVHRAIRIERAQAPLPAAAAFVLPPAIGPPAVSA